MPPDGRWAWTHVCQSGWAAMSCCADTQHLCANLVSRVTPLLLHSHWFPLPSLWLLSVFRCETGPQLRHPPYFILQHCCFHFLLPCALRLMNRGSVPCALQLMNGGIVPCALLPLRGSCSSSCALCNLVRRALQLYGLVHCALLPLRGFRISCLAGGIVLSFNSAVNLTTLQQSLQLMPNTNGIILNVTSCTTPITPPFVHYGLQRSAVLVGEAV